MSRFYAYRFNISLGGGVVVTRYALGICRETALSWVRAALPVGAAIVGISRDDFLGSFKLWDVALVAFNEWLGGIVEVENA